ncbi:Log1p KNAG_0E02620 [Huiozyma naganishii CBS 8797]|uniref:Cytokinin riboside 5'-monophosphate phosphoribohydrolase n=1 Tax=Huiozyma naganishii (strain ATCC MYA-139 / BCRC 22969 / CBS 8797 / KCTC 17520 / NBRC 10181 / NCYC 3082 / Yp74L-3) TaxID=1071383 RepID=J7S7V7_HUIN7|nr:hypothetical protein KNAG_0E02620 [Kazachstania naganishii CBS 8797]CCK70521.1 hypothetical protein KNAG_0E02620 [Kazachstania naganishii CBS 8797]
MTVQSVCVYCGSSAGNNELFGQEAAKLGALLYQLGWKLVYGGGTTGLMGSVASAAMGVRRDGRVHGIIPDALVEKEREPCSDDDGLNEQLSMTVDNHKGSTPLSRACGETTVVSDMHTRKRMMAKESDAFVAMPGGYGTFEEIMECITWSQLGIHNKPIVLFNIDGFYDSLLAFIRNSIDNGFISESNGKIVQVADTAQGVIDKIVQYNAPEGRFNLNWADECEDPRH